MRSAYEHKQASTRVYSSASDSKRSYNNSRTDDSNISQTPPTSYSSSPTKCSPIVHYNSEKVRYDDLERFFDDRQPQESPRSSIASTVYSEEEFLADLQDFEVPEFTARPYESQAIAATPSDFSELFPSSRRLAIRHDDSTIDGNMNLRVDTTVSIRGEMCDMTLFHLRMHDLKTRDFSLRRYCRDSGREVCHSTRKKPKSPKAARPSLQRSLSNALNSMRPKSSSGSSVTALTRHDSGYGSMHSIDFNEGEPPRSSNEEPKSTEKLSTDTVYLEFSNYAQVNVRRAGNNGKRYQFEYWGSHYSWKKVAHTSDRNVNQTSYQLTQAGSERVLAHIAPVALTSRQAAEEKEKGGWIPPCSMWIADESIVGSQKDLSDVIVAAGLNALVDDSIRLRFHSKNERQLLIPIPKLQMEIEYVGPKRLVNEMFRMKGNRSNRGRPSSSGTQQ